MQLVLALLIILAEHLIVDLNVQSMKSVQIIAHVRARDAEILALVHVVLTLHA
jgi:hypothetical protein